MQQEIRSGQHDGYKGCFLAWSSHSAVSSTVKANRAPRGAILFLPTWAELQQVYFKGNFSWVYKIKRINYSEAEQASEEKGSLSDRLNNEWMFQSLVPLKPLLKLTEDVGALMKKVFEECEWFTRKLGTSFWRLKAVTGHSVNCCWGGGHTNRAHSDPPVCTPHRKDFQE